MAASSELKKSILSNNRTVADHLQSFDSAWNCYTKLTHVDVISHIPGEEKQLMVIVGILMESLRYKIVRQGHDDKYPKDIPDVDWADVSGNWAKAVKKKFNNREQESHYEVSLGYKPRAENNPETSTFVVEIARTDLGTLKEKNKKQKQVRLATLYSSSEHLKKDVSFNTKDAQAIVEVILKSMDEGDAEDTDEDIDNEENARRFG